MNYSFFHKEHLEAVRHFTLPKTTKAGLVDAHLQNNSRIFHCTPEQPTPHSKSNTFCVCVCAGVQRGGEREKLQGRSGKSCRYRWFNHLYPRLNSRPFSEEEEDNGRLFGKRRYHNFISSSTGDITMSNFLTKPSTDEEAADTFNSDLCKGIKDGFPVLPQQMAAASWAFPASEITGTSMGKIPRNFLTLGTEERSNGVTTMNELSGYGESSAGPQKFRVINSHSEEPEESCTMHKNVGFIDFLGVGTS